MDINIYDYYINSTYDITQSILIFLMVIYVIWLFKLALGKEGEENGK